MRLSLFKCRVALVVWLLFTPGSLFAAKPIASFDYYVLALSWQPAFCEFHPQKKECQGSSTDVFSAEQPALHGLWPNRLNDPKHRYAYCAGKKAKGDWCEDKIAVDHAKLEKYMPGVASCLQNYQWRKHGSCSGLTVQDYFETSITLVQDFATTAIAQEIRRNIGKVVSSELLLQRWNENNKQSDGAIELVCRRHNGKAYLLEVRIALSREIESNASLKYTYNAGFKGANRGCGKKIYIDAAGIGN
ncbi:MAG: hypothetical protein OEZ43_00190 [Gammaproteobacteria bacterium]|nr:hypothetical protein [Gammaproteobacteria bacterium]